MDHKGGQARSGACRVWKKHEQRSEAQARGQIANEICLKCREFSTTLFRLPSYVRQRSPGRHHRKTLLSATKCGIVYQAFQSGLKG
jgi:hypothetical protein